MQACEEERHRAHTRGSAEHRQDRLVVFVSRLWHGPGPRGPGAAAVLAAVRSRLWGGPDPRRAMRRPTDRRAAVATQAAAGTRARRRQRGRTLGIRPQSPEQPTQAQLAF